MTPFPHVNPLSLQFKFNLAQKVAIAASGETGEVIARAEYVHSINSYYIRYRCADGRAAEAWWSEDALILAVE